MGDNECKTARFRLPRRVQVGFRLTQITWVNNARYRIRMDGANLFDSGNYTCIVWNKFGSIRHTFVVDIICELSFLHLIRSLINPRSDQYIH